MIIAAARTLYSFDNAAVVAFVGRARVACAGGRRLRCGHVGDLGAHHVDASTHRHRGGLLCAPVPRALRDGPQLRLLLLGTHRLQSLLFLVVLFYLLSIISINIM